MNKKGYWHYLFIEMPKEIYKGLSYFALNDDTEAGIGLLLMMVSFAIFCTNLVTSITLYNTLFFPRASFIFMVIGFLLFTHGYYRSR